MSVGFSELDFVNAAYASVAARFCATQKSLIDRELTVGKCIADIVCLKYRAYGHVESFAHLTTSDCVMIANLRLVSDGRLDYSKVNWSAFQADKLVTSGIIGQERHKYTLLCDSRLIKVTAIEAKLTKWKQALEQAVEYRRYADEVFVLLPEAYLPSRSNFTSFLEPGVGLLSYGDRRGLRMLLKPSPSDLHYCWRREFVISRFAQSALTSHDRFQNR